MIDIIEIPITEFEDNIYDKYIELFPEDEQREWVKIEETYKKGIEKFYKVALDNKTIGFFMLEKLNDNSPFYLDYFAIFDEFQNQGYGTKAIEKLLDKIITDSGLIGEIEKESQDNPITIKRFEFYAKLGFKKIESEYLLYNVFYTPIININSEKIVKDKMDKIFFDYYKINCGEDEVKKNCRLIR